MTCDKTSASAATISLKWNSFASEWGAYEVTGCTGVNPKLQLTAGTTYTFDQSDASNWCAGDTRRGVRVPAPRTT